MDGGWYDLYGWWSCQQEKLLWSACWIWWQPDTAAPEPLPSILLLTSPSVSVAAVHAVPVAVHAVSAAATGPPLAGLAVHAVHAEPAASGLSAAVPAAGEAPQAAEWEVQGHGGFHCLAHHCGQSGQPACIDTDLSGIAV